MIDRLRGYLDHPLDPRAGRALLAIAAAITIGFAAVVIMAARDHSGLAASRQGEDSRPRPTPPRSSAFQSGVDAAPPPRTYPRQDPQDEQGSVAARRAQAQLRTHRALQHVPYRHGGLTIELVGAQRGRAVVKASAPTISAARRGWRGFLRRYHDDGRAYEVRFHVARKVAAEVGPVAGRKVGRVVGPESREKPAEAHGCAVSGCAILPRSLRHIEVEP